MYSLDATVIDLCLKVFDWAKFRKRKGAIKLHLTRISHRENRKGNFSRFFDAALGQSRS